MSHDEGCCGMHITTCAKIVAILGIIGSILSIISAFFAWYYAPIAFIMLLTYILVFVGIQQERPSYLLPAEIILAINLAINILTVIGFIVIGIVVPNSFLNYYQDDGHTYDEAKRIIQVGFFVFAFFVAVASIYTIFALTVIHKARKYLICHLSGC